eukprot:Rhum_TRINITY_DN5048_c0_g1::Rhum_TRINITY_DN5048_c0_g1_i1::g.16412::m.16412/K17808/ZIM17, DNLZ, Tim15; mitochondrial protein import protein ZIM17
MWSLARAVATGAASRAFCAHSSTAAVRRFAVAQPTVLVPARRWCSAGAAGKDIAQKIAETDPALYHLESEEKKLGGSGIGPASADMALLFECRVCKTQAVKQFSKQSYTEGVVLIQCPGCKNKHVIADNLGWFYDMGEDNNIEKQMKSEGNELDRVAVTPEQYQSFLKGSKIDLQTGEREVVEDKPKES